MRVTLENSLIASDESKNSVLINLYLEAERDIAFFKIVLRKLEVSFSEAEPLKKRELYDEVQVVAKLIETTKAYIETLSAMTTLGFKTHTMEDNDIAVLEAQVRGIQSLRALIETPTRRNPLSVLMDEAPRMEYKISTARRWLRRTALVLGTLISAAVAVVAVAALMTPGVNIIAAAVMVPTLLASTAAFFYLRKPVVMHTPVSVGPFHTSIASVVPSSLGAATAAGLGISMFSKSRITNPLREEKARHTAAATMNGYTEMLKKKINENDNHFVNAFLLSVVDKASVMYNEGMSSRIVENRTPKTEKARMMLREIAKITEDDHFSRLTVEEILQRKVGNSQYTFEQLLNSQRNASTFWKRQSNTMRTLFENCVNDRNNESIRFSVIASAAR